MPETTEIEELRDRAPTAEQARAADLRDRGLTVVIPTYNEASGIAEIVVAVLAEAPAGTSILIVDDNSPDGTGAVADQLAADHDAVSVLHRAAKEGLGPAYVAGFAAAIGSGAGLIMQMDADFSHHPDSIGSFLERIESADVVLGSRYVPGGEIERWGSRRKAISRWGSRYAQLVLGVDVNDLTGGFKLFRTEVLEAIDLGSIRSRGYAFQVEMTYRAIRAGFRVVEVPITFHDRRVGASKMSLGIVLEAAWRIPAVRLRSRTS